MLVLVCSFALLGLWQLNVARDRGVSEAVRLAPTLRVADLDQVIHPHSAFPAAASGRRIRASGHYDAAQQVLVAPRRLHGRTGYWVVTPLVVDATGARVAVLRGFVTDLAAATPPATGRVVVSGTLAPGESPTGTPPQGRLFGSVDLAALVNRWNAPIYNAFVFATAQHPDLSPTLTRVPPPPNDPGDGLAWRNAAYALQWWVFALFAIFMWWRMTHDEIPDDSLTGRPEQILHPRPDEVAREVPGDLTGRGTGAPPTVGVARTSDPPAARTSARAAEHDGKGSHV